MIKLFIKLVSLNNSNQVFDIACYLSMIRHNNKIRAQTKQTQVSTGFKVSQFTIAETAYSKQNLEQNADTINQVLAAQFDTEIKKKLAFNIKDIRKAKRETQQLVDSLSQKILLQEQMMQEIRCTLTKKNIIVKSQTRVIHELSMKVRQKDQENQALRRAVLRQKQKANQLNEDIVSLVRQRIESEKNYKSRIMELQSQIFMDRVNQLGNGSPIRKHALQKNQIYYDQSTML